MEEELGIEPVFKTTTRIKRIKGQATEGSAARDESITDLQKIIKLNLQKHDLSCTVKKPNF